MNDAGLTYAMRGLLQCLKKKDGEAFRANVGADYSGIIDAVFCRMTWPGDKRTKPQNALLHQWFGEIAEHFGDRSAREVKGEAHRDIGLTYKLREPVFAWVWAQTGANLSPEKQAKYLASGAVTFSSTMSRENLREYMADIERTYRAQGVPLTIPEAA